MKSPYVQPIPSFVDVTSGILWLAIAQTNQGTVYQALQANTQMILSEDVVRELLEIGRFESLTPATRTSQSRFAA